MGSYLYFITAVPISAYLFSWSNGHISGIENLKGYWAGNLLDLIYYPAIFISYYIFNALVRISAINWVFTHTTMTHLSFWGRYREPDTKFKDIAVKNKGISNQP